VDRSQDARDAAGARKRVRGGGAPSRRSSNDLFLWNGRSFVRKGLEAYFTVLLELTWPKQRILEVYLNIAEFGDGIYGADAAARVFFREAPAQLGG
jgi:monofunctional biosynthetic peptidoglycan transglycosylase